MKALVSLVANDSTLLPIHGTVIEGDGIYDEQWNPYPAGIDQEGKIYATELDTNGNILRSDGLGILSQRWSDAFNQQTS